MMTYPLGMGAVRTLFSRDSRKHRSFLVSCHTKQQTTDILIVRIQNFHQMLSEIQTFPATQSEHDIYYHFNGTSSLTDN